MPNKIRVTGHPENVRVVGRNSDTLVFSIYDAEMVTARSGTQYVRKVFWRCVAFASDVDVPALKALLEAQANDGVFIDLTRRNEVKKGPDGNPVTGPDGKRIYEDKYIVLAGKDGVTASAGPCRGPDGNIVALVRVEGPGGGGAPKPPAARQAPPAEEWY
jgi:hypothetical protein